MKLVTDELMKSWVICRERKTGRGRGGGGLGRKRDLVPEKRAAKFALTTYTKYYFKCECSSLTNGQHRGSSMHQKYGLEEVGFF